MSYKISIITVNFNNKVGLQKTIASVLSQTFKNFEFIIVDGASTDGSKALLADGNLETTKWISEPDNGIYHAMNKGIKMSKGDYLLFLNSGDALINDEVLHMLDQKIDSTYDIYYGDIIFDQAEKTTKIIFPERLTFGFFFRDNLSHQATFIKRSLFNKYFYYNEKFKIVSDWEFLIYVICKENVSYKHLNLITTLYDGNGISSKSNNYKTVYDERATSLAQHFPAFVKDYENISKLETRRMKQILRIQKSSIAWGMLKVFVKMIFFFLPKQKSTPEKDTIQRIPL